MPRGSLDRVQRRARYLLQRREQKRAERLARRIVDLLNLPYPYYPLETRPEEEKRARPPAQTDPAVDSDADTDLDPETKAECQRYLHEYMKSWLASGCRLDKWPLGNRLLEDINRKEIAFGSDEDGRAVVLFKRKIMTFWWEPPDPLGRRNVLPGEMEASEMFFQFITGPYYRDIGQCKRCRNLYLNIWGHSDKTYCSQRCASADSAVKKTRERREREHREKLGRVGNGIRDFLNLSPERQARIGARWKSRVANALPGVTVHFITRSINRGQLKLPQGLKGKKLIS